MRKDGQSMGQGGSVHIPASLAGAATRYPEKAFYLGQVFNDTTNSYKLFWFLGLLSALRRTEDHVIRLVDLLNEMAVAAWHPVCLFRLSLGRQDKLQAAVISLQRQSGLDVKAEPDDIRGFLQRTTGARSQLDPFRRYVPTRFLAPWFAGELRGVDDARRGGLLLKLAAASQSGPFACPYWFDGADIRFNAAWRAFLIENLGVVKAFAEHHLTVYLQARNPNVPSVVNKLCAPSKRKLTAAHTFWHFARVEIGKCGRRDRFRDIYSETELSEDFAIDHFLPWSFVAHDQLWNLAPVHPLTNSRKNDVLPDLDLYLPRLARLHFDAIQAAGRHPKMLEDYTDCFKLDTAGLLALDQDGLTAKYREVMAPQTQLATNLGFQSGWSLPRTTVDLVGRSSVEAERGRESGTVPMATDSGPPGGVTETKGDDGPRRRQPAWLPFYPLEVAAGGFLAGDAPSPERWVDVAKRGFAGPLMPGMFVTKVIGHSMEPRIKHGAICVFQHPVVGSRQGRILLVQKRAFSDPETGGSYTVKRYRSTKTHDETGWWHESIELVPDNPDRTRYPVLRFVPRDDQDLRVIAEFIAALEPSEIGT